MEIEAHCTTILREHTSQYIVDYSINKTSTLHEHIYLP